MKKIILAAGASLMMLAGMASCNGSSSSAAGASDSTSTTMGEFNGSMLNQQMASVPEEMRAKYNKDEILKGIEYMINMDTTKTSYFTGLSIGQNLAGMLMQMEESGISVDRKAFMNAFKQAFLADSVGDMVSIQARYQKVMNAVQQQMMAEQQKKAEAEAKAKENSPEAKKNKADGAAFVAKKMKEDPSIKKTASGLAYKVLEQGTGEMPTDADQVVVAYKGTLINGKEFDSNDNATFPVRGVVPGFAEALKMMNPGSHYVIYIPAELAYGVDGTPDGSIPPMSTLVFDVTVKSIAKK